MKLLRRTLGSPRLALTLIILVGVWSMLATMIPQGHDDAPEVMAWAAGKGVLATITAAAGLHEAFSAPVFIVAAVALMLSTAVCSWDRTRAALRRGRALRAGARVTSGDVASAADLSIAIKPVLDDAEVLERTVGALESIGIKARADAGVVRAVSPWWSVWGSPIFHWALVLLALAAFAGVLFRAEGNMVIPIGETKPDAPESYLVLDAGRLHRWDGVERSIRVDDFDPAMKKGDLELGAVPTVSVLDGNGDVIATEDVYPNNKLHAGSLSINAPTCGLTATIVLQTASGDTLPPVVQLVAFSQEASGGTEPLQPLVASDDSGQVLLRLMATVPLDPRGDGTYGEWIPRDPAAHIVLEDSGGSVLYDGIIHTGESAELNGGGTVQLIDIGWYTHLALVDDPSIPVVYAAMVLALLGLTLSLAGRQMLVVATPVADADGGRSLAVMARLWRNVPTDRAEMERVLAEALGRLPEGESA